MVDALISSLVQVAFALLLSLVIYLIFGRRSGTFWNYIGLIATTPLSAGLGLLLGGVAVAATLQVPGLRELAAGPHSAIAKATAAGLGPATAVALAAQALLQTSLSEEILFRGLIGKRLINKFGFPVGNLLQALLFGTLHFALFYPLAGLETLGVLFAYSTAFGWLLGLLKEKVGRGSILPGWVAHGTANLVTYLGLAYGVI